MKRLQLCPKCGGEEVGLVECLPDDTRKQGISYMALGTAPADRSLMDGYMQGRRGAKSKPRVKPDDLKVGTVEAYVCTGCGFTERHVQDPGWMDFLTIKGFTMKGQV